MEFQQLSTYNVMYLLFSGNTNSIKKNKKKKVISLKRNLVCITNPCQKVSQPISLKATYINIFMYIDVYDDIRRIYKTTFFPTHPCTHHPMYE